MIQKMKLWKSPFYTFKIKRYARSVSNPKFDQLTIGHCVLRQRVASGLKSFWTVAVLLVVFQFLSPGAPWRMKAYTYA